MRTLPLNQPPKLHSVGESRAPRQAISKKRTFFFLFSFLNINGSLIGFSFSTYNERGYIRPRLSGPSFHSFKHPGKQRSLWRSQWVSSVLSRYELSNATGGESRGPSGSREAPSLGVPAYPTVKWGAVASNSWLRSGSTPPPPAALPPTLLSRLFLLLFSSPPL